MNSGQKCKQEQQWSSRFYFGYVCKARARGGDYIFARRLMSKSFEEMPSLHIGGLLQDTHYCMIEFIKEIQINESIK